MIKPLLARDAIKGLICLLFFFLGVSSIQAQDPIISATECICEINDNKRFREEIFVWGDPADAWSVKEAIGLFDGVNSLTPLSGSGMDQGGGHFLFIGWRNNNSTYCLTIVNDADPLDCHKFVPNNICNYPDLSIHGDDGVCVNTTHEYYLNIPPDQIDNLMWSLSGGGTIIGDPTSPVIQVDWGPNAGGPHQLTVMADISVGNGPPLASCDLDATLEVTIVDEGSITLACDNWVNISLDLDCSLEVLPDMILEGMQFTNSSYDVILKDLDEDTLFTEPIINGAHVSKLLGVTIHHECSWNSCWGYILVEDKFVPPLVCESTIIECDESTDPEDLDIGFPLPDGIDDPMKIGENSYNVMGFDLCGDATLTYLDSSVVQGCDTVFGSIIYRKWKVTDQSGRMNMCYDTINVMRTDIMNGDAIVWPPDFDVNNPLICTDKDASPPGNFWVSQEDGSPAPIDIDEGGTGYPEFIMCGNIQVIYYDTKFEKCGGASYKLKRLWHILDWCTGQIATHNQLISILDTVPPICIGPDEDLIAYTNPGECLTSFKVPPLDDIIDCSETTVEVGYKPQKDGEGAPDSFSSYITEGVTGPNAQGYFTIPDTEFPGDSVWIAYLVTDVCGNYCEVFREVRIIDNEEPVAVCDLHTKVGLNNSGMAWAHALAFDDESNDNCGISKYEVRRMGYLNDNGDIINQNSSCGVLHSWEDKAKFCCEDVGKTLVVQMRVTDGNGNSNVCMAQVIVQDNTPPVLLSCPDNVTISCTDDYSDLSQFGFPEFEDNCNFEESYNENININECGVGLIVRSWSGVDSYGNQAVCNQFITVAPPHEITQNDIIWPLDYTPSNGCPGTAIDPDNLPLAYAEPRIKSNIDLECRKIAMDYEDLVFHYVDGACIKIIRTWTVIDWCQFNYDDKGVLYHSQLIKIHNSTPPVITTQEPALVTLDECEWDVKLSATAEDDCPDAVIKWKVEVDFHNDGTVEIYKTSNNADGIYPQGTHKITWKATDECGNEGVKEQIIEIIDEKEPTPVCISELVTVIMEQTQSVIVWAVDFSDKSYDNCPGTIDISFSGTSRSQSSESFTCEDLGGESQKLFELQIWAWDQNGNRDFCTVHLKVQDNTNVCSSQSSDPGEDVSESNTIEYGQVSGLIQSESEVIVSGVEVMVDTEMEEFPLYRNTDSKGEYAFESLPMHHEYEIHPKKVDDPLNGVSTLDMVLIQKHIMGITPLNSPYKVIAADANNSQSISAVDLVILRKLILGLIDKLPGDKTWRFVDSHHNFLNSFKPFPFPELIRITDLNEDMANSNFIAVKIGDVNGNAKKNSITEVESRQTDHAELYIENVTLQPSERIVVPVTIDDLKDFIGLQISFEFDSRYLMFEDVYQGSLDLRPENIALNKLDQGIISMSWHVVDEFDLSSQDKLFGLVFRGLKNGTLGDHLKINNKQMRSEIYCFRQNAYEERDISLVFDRINDRNEGFGRDQTFRLNQNIPNPFTKSTKIDFTLPESSDVKLNIIDLSGSLVHQIKDHFDAGSHSIEINSKDLNVTGLLYYQLETNIGIATKKMIIIK